MRVVVSEPAAELIAERGGRHYVWLTKAGCCRGVTRLSSGSEAPAGKEFRRVPTDADFEVYVPDGLAELPDELHIEARRFPRRVESYWNGCVWVV
jgi:hypothetical protein